MFTQEESVKDNTVTLQACLPGKALLKDSVCRQAIDTLREIIPLTKSDFDQFYLATIERFSEYVQNIPATREAFYAEPFGFLQLSLDRAIISTRLALKGFEELEDIKAQELSAINQAELFAIFAAALLSDLGLIPLRFQIQVVTSSGMNRPYDLYAGSLNQQGASFTYEFYDEELGDWSAPASLVLAQQVLKTTSNDYSDSAFAWLSQHHEVLQFWYGLMLQYAQAQEGSTRRRYFASLLPNADHDVLEQFLDRHFPYRGGLVPKRSAFFSDQEILAIEELLAPEESSAEAERLLKLKKDKERIEREKAKKDKERKQEQVDSFERVFGSSGPTDATSARILGSISAQMSPQLKHGFAFARWLMLLVKMGRLAEAGDQNFVIRPGNGDALIDWEKAFKAFSKEVVSEGKTPISASDMLKALRSTHFFKDSYLSLQQFIVNQGRGNQRFAAIVLPENLIFGRDGQKPPVTLGVMKVTSNAEAAPPKATKTLTVSYRHRAVFDKKL